MRDKTNLSFEPTTIVQYPKFNPRDKTVVCGNVSAQNAPYTVIMEKNAAQKLNKKEKNNLFEIKDYENTIYELLKERFWEESAPVNKLLKAISGSIILKKDNWADEFAYRGIEYASKKRWMARITPAMLLNRTLKESLETISTLSESGDFYKIFPPKIETPPYGDKWGRNANYIEINNRAIARMQKDKCSGGMLSAIKLLGAIPPSARSWANCVILSQLFPNIYGDGYNKAPWEENSLYGIRFNTGYSANILLPGLENQTPPVSPEEQIRAFNDIAHFRGLKTGFRMLISEDQLKIASPDKPDEPFKWENDEHVEIFINENVKAVNLGFDAIFFDSLKHVDGYQPHFYTGVGKTPDYELMQYIFYEIRSRSNRNDLSFAGERCDWDINRYKGMGVTCGTAWGNADDIEDIKRWSEEYKYCREYAPGPEVSNDNDEGWYSYEERLNRMRSCLFGYNLASDKLPSFMQMHDLFPLRYDTNTHHLMMCNPSYSAFGDANSHWNNLFTKEDGIAYNHHAGEIFAYALNM